jgi:hypothetical protein
MAAPAPAPQAIAQTLEAILAQESLNNERKIAFVRVVIFLISTPLDILAFFFPNPSLVWMQLGPISSFLAWWGYWYPWECGNFWDGRSPCDTYST